MRYKSNQFSTLQCMLYLGIFIIVNLSNNGNNNWFSYVSFFGTQPMPFICSDSDLLRLSTVFPSIWEEPDSSSQRRLSPCLRAECAYRHQINAIKSKVSLYMHTISSIVSPLSELEWTSDIAQNLSETCSMECCQQH